MTPVSHLSNAVRLMVCAVILVDTGSSFATDTGLYTKCPSHLVADGDIAGDDVKLRAMPELSGKILRRLDYGVPVRITERTNACVTYSDKTGRWVKVLTLDQDEIKEGWIFDYYVAYHEGKDFHSPEIALVGKTLKDGLPAFPSAAWIGLTKTSGGYELKSYRVKIVKLSTSIIEGVPMYEVSTIPIDKEVLFLMRDLPNIKPGKIVAASPATLEAIDWKDQRQILALGSTKYRLKTGCVKRARAAKEEPNQEGKYYKCAVILSGPSGDTFTLENSAGAMQPKIMSEPAHWVSWAGNYLVRWAGDLDRDGKLDFVLYFDGDKGTATISLYLSSLASPGQMVGKAAERNYQGD